MCPKSHGGLNGTLVIMTTSIIKVWHVAIEESDQPLMTSAIAKFPMSNLDITVSQLIWILILALLVNLTLTHFDVIDLCLVEQYQSPYQ